MLFGVTSVFAENNMSKNYVENEFYVEATYISQAFPATYIEHTSVEETTEPGYIIFAIDEIAPLINVNRNFNLNNIT